MLDLLIHRTFTNDPRVECQAIWHNLLKQDKNSK